MTQPVIPPRPDAAAQAVPPAARHLNARPGAATTGRPERATGRQLLPLQVDDLSAFAKHLRQQWQAHQQSQPELPGHLQMLNMLARAAGHRNVQSLKAQVAADRAAAARQALALPAAHPPEGQADDADLAHDPHDAFLPAAEPAAGSAALPVLTANAAKAMTQFDDWGRLTRWPHKYSVQRLAMWALWIRFDAARRYSEREVNEILKAWTVYGDHVTPRRELIEMKLLGREPDCSVYWKERQRPDDEVRALLQALRARRPV